MAIEVAIVILDDELDRAAKAAADKMKAALLTAAPDAEFVRRARETFNRIPPEAMKAAQAVAREFSQIPKNVQSGFQTLTRAAGSTFDRVVSGAKSAASAVANITRNGLDSVVSGFKRLEGNVGGAIGKLSALGNLPGLGGLNQIAGGLSSVSTGLGAIGGPAGVAAIGIGLVTASAIGGAKALFDMALAGSRTADGLKDMSLQTGLSVETLQVIGIAARQSGSSIEAFTQASGVFAQKLEQVAASAEKSAAFTKAFGIDVKQAIQEPEKALLAFGKALVEIESPTLRAAAAKEFLGRAGITLLPTFQALNEEGGALADQLTRMGRIAGTDVVEAASKLDDKVEALKDRFSNFTVHLSANTAPEFERFIDQMGQAMDRLIPVTIRVADFVVTQFNRMAAVAAFFTTEALGAYRVAAALSSRDPAPPTAPGIPLQPTSPAARAALEQEIRNLLNPPKPPPRVRTGGGGVRTRPTVQTIGGGALGSETIRGGAGNIATLDADTFDAANEALRDYIDTQQKYLQLVGQLNDASIDRNTLTQEERTRIELLSSEYRDLTEEQRQLLIARAHEVDQLHELREAHELQARAAEQAAEDARRAYEQFGQDITNIFENAFGNAFERGPKAFFSSLLGGFRQLITGIVSQVAAASLSATTTPLLARIFGGGGAAGGTFSSGGGGGISSILGGFLGGARGGGAGGFLTPTFNPSGGGGFSLGSIAGNLASSSFSGAQAGPSISGQLPLNLLNRNALFESAGLSGLKTGGGFFSKLNGLFSGVGGIGALIGPALLGGSLGSGLGGQSTAGRILGGIGGGAVGIGALLGASVFGAGGGLGAAALAALGPAALIGAPLLVAAILLGKAKQRGKDEQLADSYWTAEAQAVQELTRNVNSDRIDGGDALAQAAALRQQTIAQLNTIKTASVRDSRLRNQLPDVDRVYVSQLRTAVERQSIRRRIGPLLIPEFDRGGFIPGFDRGYDSVLLMGRPGEVILNRRQQQEIERRAGSDIFRQAGVPGFADGGQVPQGVIGTSKSETIVIEVGNVVLNVTKEEAGKIVFEGVRTSDGRDVVIKTMRGARLNRNT